MPAKPVRTYLIILSGLVVAILQVIFLPVEAWDEARRGVNAWEMLARHDYLNYHYLGAPDTFNTKPPLFTWLVALSFHLFGTHAVALRLPSLLALAGFLLYYRHWLARRFGSGTAILTIGAIVATQGIMGYHVGVSGDTDMLFVGFLTAASLKGYDFLSGARSRDLILAALLAGLAFLTKGVAAFLVFPGVLAFTLGYGGRHHGREALPGLGVAALAGGGLLILLGQAGRYPGYDLPYANLLEAMLQRDGVQRLLDAGMEPATGTWSVIQALDIRFGPLVYFLYAGLPYLIWRYGLSGVATRVRADRFAVFCACLVASVLLILQFSSNRHNWYVAPAVPFLAYLFARCTQALFPDPRGHRILIGGVVAYALAGRLFGLGDGAQVPSLPEIPGSATPRIMYADEHLPQDYLFHLYEGLPPGSSVERLRPELGLDDCVAYPGIRVCRGTRAPSPK